MKQMLQGKIQITVDYTFIGSVETLQNLLDTNNLEAYISMALSELAECHPSLIFDEQSIRAINIPRIENVEDHQT
ncbi:MAG: hypothetical protein ACRC2R_16880 [Xenococcaceae cyanobacterium]